LQVVPAAKLQPTAKLPPAAMKLPVPALKSPQDPPDLPQNQ
jgi:hypothetical protein